MKTIIELILLVVLGLILMAGRKPDDWKFGGRNT